MREAKVFGALHYCKRHAMIKENFEVQETTGDEYNSHL